MPVLAAGALLVASSATARADLPSVELRTHDYAAWYHCTTGFNQYPSFVNNHCYYTSATVTYEYGYWWCATYMCPSTWQCSQPYWPYRVGGKIAEIWKDRYGNNISASSDCLVAVVSYPWWDVYGP
jgi:hypothetical protein